MVKPTLWPHQQAAKDFVNGKKAAMLAMVMRSGKSRVTVELLDERTAMNTLLICPKSVLDVWPEQFQQYSERMTQCLVLKKGTLQQRTDQAKYFIQSYSGAQQVSKVIIINIDAFWREPFFSWAMKYQWDAFVMDESHRLKAPGGKASRAAAMLAHGGGAQRPEIPFRLALTGTPMPHDPLDLYAQYRILDHSVLGTSYQRLKMRYAVTANIPGAPVPIIKGWRVQQGPYYVKVLADEFDAKFHSLAYVVGPEVLNIPEPLHITRYCELTSKGRRIYGDLEKDFYAEVEAGEITASNALVKALRLQQTASGFARLADAEGSEIEIDDSKKALLADLLADVDEPVVVFCRFRHDLDTVHSVCVGLGRGSLELSGRVNHLESWQAGGARVLAVQTQTGGVGIDLSRAKIAIYYSLGLSLGDHLQSLARLQAKDMNWHPAYYYLLAKGTVDEKVYRALHDRKDVIEEIMRR